VVSGNRNGWASRRRGFGISLHAVRDELRDTLVPLNKKYPIKQLMQAARLSGSPTPGASPSNM